MRTSPAPKQVTIDPPIAGVATASTVLTEVDTLMIALEEMPSDEGHIVRRRIVEKRLASFRGLLS